MTRHICFSLQLVVSLITLSQAHTWIEELSVVNSTDGLIGAPGYPRGFGLSSQFLLWQ
jgi:hypothetical protein